MNYKLDEKAWERQCDSCGIKLTEVLTNPLPKSEFDSWWSAIGAGWVVSKDDDYCFGCRNV